MPVKIHSRRAQPAGLVRERLLGRERQLPAGRRQALCRDPLRQRHERCFQVDLVFLEAAQLEAGFYQHRGQFAVVVDALDRKSTRLNSSHIPLSRMPSSA